MKGTSFDEALLKGLGTYVKEGGSLSGLPVPELNVVLETPELLKKAEDVLRTVGSVVDDTVLQPPKEFVEAVAESTPSPKVIEDIAREAGSTAEDVVRTAGAVIDEPVQVIKEAAESIYEPLEAPDFPSLEAPDLPSLEISTDVDLPSVDLDLPSVDLDIPAPSIGLSISQPQPTKGVTESLFEDFLFEKKYQAPELIARTVPLAQYTAPQGMFRNIV